MIMVRAGTRKKCWRSWQRDDGGGGGVGDIGFFLRERRVIFFLQGRPKTLRRGRGKYGFG